MSLIWLLTLQIIAFNASKYSSQTQFSSQKKWCATSVWSIIAKTAWLKTKKKWTNFFSSRAITSSTLNQRPTNSRVLKEESKGGIKRKTNSKKFTQSTSQIQFAVILLSSWGYSNTSRSIKVIRWLLILNGSRTSCCSKRLSTEYSTWSLAAGIKLFLSHQGPSTCRGLKTPCCFLESMMGTGDKPMIYQSTRTSFCQTFWFPLSS